MPGEGAEKMQSVQRRLIIIKKSVAMSLYVAAPGTNHISKLLYADYAASLRSKLQTCICCTLRRDQYNELILKRDINT